jgi:hypothetical protein
VRAAPAARHPPRRQRLGNHRRGVFLFSRIRIRRHRSEGLPPPRERLLPKALAVGIKAFVVRLKARFIQIEA